jgi:NAD(P)H-nitrite reductase large subunit
VKIVILGNGISGITAARHIRKLSDNEILVISGETDYFFSRTALMYIYMGHMKFEHTKPYEDNFWKKNRIDLKKCWIEQIDIQKKQLRVHNSGEIIPYDKLILALGSQPNVPNFEGVNRKGVQGFYSLQDLDNLEKISPEIQQAVVVGGGLIGIELAEMLHSRHKKVIFMIREKHFWANVLIREEAEMIEKHLEEHGIELRFSTEIQRINGNENNQVCSITTTNNEEISCQFVGLAVGVSPAIAFVKNTEIATKRGIMVNQFLETNQSDIYAIGDCVEHQEPPKGRKNIEQIWYSGREMGETVAKTICQEKTAYQPSVFFNSAKFFTIEYQTYGFVPAQKSENDTFFVWKHATKNIFFRFNYDTKNNEILGVNTFGSRQRQDVWTQWILEKKSIEFVLENLSEANFDPEFFRTYEKEIIEKYNLENNKSLQPKTKKNWLKQLFIK